MNDALDTLNAILDAIVGALAVGLHAAGRAMLANVSAAEWMLAAALAGSAWLIAIGRGWRAAGLLVFLASVTACAWLDWKSSRYGALAQQVVLAAMVLQGVRGRGWALAGKEGAR